MAKQERRVSQTKIDLAKKELEADPLITVRAFQDKYDLCVNTACIALKQARIQLQAKDNKVSDRAQSIRLRQQEEALKVLELQIARLSELPIILQALREATFTLKGNQITGIRDDPSGKKSPAQLVKEYLDVEKQILDQERLITGIELAERSTTAKAGATSISLVAPLGSMQSTEIKPLNLTIEADLSIEDK